MVPLKWKHRVDYSYYHKYFQIGEMKQSCHLTTQKEMVTLHTLKIPFSGICLFLFAIDLELVIRLIIHIIKSCSVFGTFAPGLKMECPP